MKHHHMIIEIKVPSPGESIVEVQLASWLVSDGEQVEKDEDFAEIDSDKATLTISSEASGKITFTATEGDTVKVGAVIASIDTEAKGKKKERPAEAEKKEIEESKEVPVQEKKEKVKAEDEILHLSPLAKKLMQDSGSSEEEFIEFFRKYRIGKKDVGHFLAERTKQSSASTPALPGAWKGAREEKRKKLPI